MYCCASICCWTAPMAFTCKKQVFQLLHCGAVWPVDPAKKTEDTRKKMDSKHGRMKTSITTAMKAPFWRQQKWCYQANPNIQIWIWTIQTQESRMLVISLELYKNHPWICWIYLPWSACWLLDRAEQFKACCLGFVLSQQWSPPSVTSFKKSRDEAEKMKERKKSI